MLVALQFPFIDVRSFVDAPTNKLSSPAFPIALPGREFMRLAGVVERRKQGGVDEWAGEDVYCRAARAVRFVRNLKRMPLAEGVPAGSCRCVFRRYMSDGITSRLELGFSVSAASAGNGGLTERDLGAVLATLLQQRVRVSSSDNDPVSLIESGRVLASHFLRCTTRRIAKVLAEVQPWWIEHGEPLVLVEHQRREIAQIPNIARTARIGGDGDIELSYSRSQVRHQDVALWYLSHEAGRRTESRPYRLHILRLHAEREGLKQVLHALARERVRIVPGTPSSESIQSYLNRASRLLNRQGREGVDQSRLLDIVSSSTDTLSPGDRESLRNALANARRNIARKIEAFVNDAAAKRGATTVFRFSPESSPHFSIGDHMTNTTITFGDNARIDGDFTVVTAKTIQNAFNKVGKANAPPELKKALETLSRQVAEMAKQMEAAKSEAAARDLETLVTEATSSQPRRKWWEMSIDGLVEAAKTLGQVASPVIATASQVAKLLGA